MPRDDRINPILDLLEKYLKDGKNIIQSQKERWSGDYPLTVLDEAIRKIYGRLGFTSLGDLVAAYPKTEYRLALEEMLLDIGNKQLDFNKIRDKEVDFAITYHIPPKEEPKKGDDSPPVNDNPTGKLDGGPMPQQPRDQTPHSQPQNPTGNDGSPLPTTPAPSQPEKPKSTQLGTSKHVKAIEIVE